MVPHSWCRQGTSGKQTREVYPRIDQSDFLRKSFYCPELILWSQLISFTNSVLTEQPHYVPDTCSVHLKQKDQHSCFWSVSPKFADLLDPKHSFSVPKLSISYNLYLTLVLNACVYKGMDELTVKFTPGWSACPASLFTVPEDLGLPLFTHMSGHYHSPNCAEESTERLSNPSCVIQE